MSKKFGDRKDGKRIRNISALHKVMPHLMNNRTDAEVYLSEKIDITEVLKYLEKKNKGLENHEKMTLFHTLITAFGKTIYERPLLNRFVQGKRHYDRNEISFGFVAKNKFEDDAHEMVIKLVLNDEDNADSIKNFILTKVSTARKESTNDMDKTLNLLTSGPRFLTAFIIWIIKRLDFHGWLPKSFTDMDPNYATVFMTNLGSIKCNQVYHHLNNYGTNSIFFSIGTMTQEEIIRNGKKEIRDIVPVGVTVDERIADGFYFAKSIMLFKHIMENPSLLDEAMKEKVDYEI